MLKRMQQKVPVSVSNGANKAEITMPDGTVTKLVVKDGKWTVAAGTTNTAVKEGDQLGDASATAASKINIPVTSDSTQYVGVDSIVAKATTDKVRADLQREVVKVKDANNKEYTATFNSATGKYTLPNEDAYVLKDNGDGTTTLTDVVFIQMQKQMVVLTILYTNSLVHGMQHLQQLL